MHILVLADSYNSTKKYHNAVTTIRQGSRWLQGRGSQSYWDACEDDREFDVVGSVVGRSGTVAPGMYELDINARHRLAVSRIKIGDIEEGQVRLFRSHPYPSLTHHTRCMRAWFWRRIFGNMLHCFPRSRTHTTSRRCTRPLLRSTRSLVRIPPCVTFFSTSKIHSPIPEQTSSIYVLERAAACRRMNGDLESSAAIYEQGSVSMLAAVTDIC
jgi:hypothetical protein